MRVLLLSLSPFLSFTCSCRSVLLLLSVFSICLSSPSFLLSVGFVHFVVRFSPDSNELQGENLEPE